MSTRNFSPQAMFEQWARQQTPRYRFTGSTPGDFAAWKDAALPAVLATLGEFPEKVPPNAELEAIYRAAGVPERLVLDIIPKGHGWGGDKTIPFFKEQLLDSRLPLGK